MKHRVDNTTHRTTTGLKVRAKLDKRRYPSGLKITDKQMKSLALKRDTFHGEWNYVISPRAG